MRYLKENSKLKEAFIEADYQSVRQQTQLRDEISKSDEDCLYTYEQLEDAKAKIKKLKAARRSGSQSNKNVLEQVGKPEANTARSISTSMNW